MSGLNNFFSKNHNNLDLSLGDKGMNISGGENKEFELQGHYIMNQNY